MGKVGLKAFYAAMAMAGAMALPGVAGAVTLTDTYYGGLNTYNNNAPTSGDVIGTSDFEIYSADFTRVDGGSTLRVVINTNYAGVAGTLAAEGTGYGALFFTPGVNAWTPQGPGVAPYYVDDQYQVGDWTYAFALPQTAGLTGTGSLYSITYSNDTVDPVIRSNVNGSFSTYPHDGHAGYYFREGQPVQFNTAPNVSTQAVASGDWTMDTNPLHKSITVDIHDGGALGNNFAFSWAMTCANDIIQGQILGVPEPGTWGLMLLGFGGAGAALRRRRAMLA